MTSQMIGVRTSNYRPDVDGLRAFAVLSVLIYHFFPSALPSGFTGVDVFFVISGYVITRSNIIDVQNGAFGWLAFYQRRFRRLMPALSIVLVCCLLAGTILMLPAQLEALGLSALAGAGFVPNLLF